MKTTFLLAAAAAAALGLAQPADAAPGNSTVMRQMMIAAAQPPVLSQKVVALKLVEQGYTEIASLTHTNGVFIAEAYKGDEGPFSLIVDGRTGVVVAVATE